MTNMGYQFWDIYLYSTSSSKDFIVLFILVTNLPPNPSVWNNLNLVIINFILKILKKHLINVRFFILIF